MLVPPTGTGRRRGGRLASPLLLGQAGQLAAPPGPAPLDQVRGVQPLPPQQRPHRSGCCRGVRLLQDPPLVLSRVRRPPRRDSGATADSVSAAPPPRGRGQALVRSAHSLTDPGSPAQDRRHGLAGQRLVSHSVGPARPAAGVHAPLARDRQRPSCCLRAGYDCGRFSVAGT